MNFGIWITAGLGLVTLLVAATWWLTSRSRVALPESSQQAHSVRGRRPNVAPMIAGIGVLLIALGAWFAYSGAGTGWSLAGGTLSVKTGFGNAAIPVSQARAEWVSPTGPYGLALRTNGVSAGALQAGKFRTNNGQSVLAFHYGGGHRWLLVRDSQTQVLISTPHVESLAKYISLRGTANILPVQHRQSPTLALLVHLAMGTAVGLVFVLAQLAMAKRVAPGLPEKMITHWGVDGKPDGWMKKQTALRVMPSIAIVMALIGVAASLATYTALVIFGFVQLVILGVARLMYRANSKG
ncbi:DUF1648 domain-containing protein [Alicyclobacillus sp. ALC3]|uniref:DUF1648 domain-containing protein n=1 Tax=Alicyclobacillus sp. ALC3 TaxID=2796143 RepID=UPI00237839FD|nr:DUF1648 domain-containing protein [Alicyclobacillus sp. ALC3]WDL98620.1 DUF1648 domain-containing protein [Alicyclobacillus sp. ALC3]